MKWLCFVSVCAMFFVSGALEYRRTAVTYFRVIVLMKDRDYRSIFMAVSVRSVWLKSSPDSGEI